VAFLLIKRNKAEIEQKNIACYKISQCVTTTGFYNLVFNMNLRRFVPSILRIFVPSIILKFSVFTF